MLCRLLAVLLVSSCVSSAFAQTSLDRIDLLPRQGTSDAAVAPVYSQIFLYALPDEFRTVSSGVVRKGRFVQQSVPAKETVQRWTQMITLSGDEALAFSGRTYPQKMIEDFVGLTKKKCPDSFSTLTLNNVFVGSYDTVVAVVSCGMASGGQSEAIMQMVIKGGMDMYTLEWTVRGRASRGPVKLEEVQWTDRLRRMAPVRICSAAANEQPPFPSCLKRR